MKAALTAYKHHFQTFYLKFRKLFFHLLIGPPPPGYSLPCPFALIIVGEKDFYNMRLTMFSTSIHCHFISLSIRKAFQYLLS